jgi:hypothetical protein
MTVYVKESSKSILAGLSKMKTAMIKDYNSMSFNDEMKANFAEGISVEYGKKYIKIVKTLGSQRMVWGFIVGVDNDKKFKLGDILKPAGWKAPARNAARGNILDGGYPINWTGPLYL